MASAEQRKSYKIVKNFKGLDTKANRTAIDRDEFSWIENAIPIGPGNIKIIPTSSTVSNAGGNTVVFSNTVSYLTSANLGDDYILASQADGSMQYFDLITGVQGNVAAAGTFSTVGVALAQYQNTNVYIGDPAKGLFSWDNSNLVAIGSVGVIAITNPGTGYTSAPNVTISAPNQTGGVRATATATTTAATADNTTRTTAAAAATTTRSSIHRRLTATGTTRRPPPRSPPAATATAPRTRSCTPTALFSRSRAQRSSSTRCAVR